MKERGSAYLRFLDRYLGIPIVFVLGLFKIKRVKALRPKTIGILKTAGIGETVLLLGIIADLQKAIPEARILFFSGFANADMARLIPGVEVVPLPMVNPIRALLLIRKYKCDWWLDFGPWPKINAIFSFFALARYKIGFKTEGQYRHFVYDYAVDHRRDVHEIENYRNLVSVLGICGKNNPQLSMKKSPGKSVVMHLFAGGSRAYLKEWPEEKWLELIDKLAQLGWKIILTGSKKDYSRLNELLKNAARPECVEIAAGRFSLEETANLLAAAKATISIDTGIMHLAAAVGSPLIALHGPTSPSRWGAIGQNVKVIMPKIKYRPCIHLGFESICSENRCMRAIEVDEVVEAFHQMVTDEDRDFSRRERKPSVASFERIAP